jgi:hypothetical protein
VLTIIIVVTDYATSHATEGICGQASRRHRISDHSAREGRHR